MALKDLQDAAVAYSLQEFPAEYGPGKKFLTQQHMEAQLGPQREVARKHFLAGCTYGITLLHEDPTKATIE